MTKEENEKRIERLKGIVLSMPEKPGSYQFYDSEGTIIYVGKAKKLKSRVSSYFHTEVDRFKTKVLVSKIWNLTYTVVNTEEDALLLENSLIKKYNPKYNVLLKDGKTYPSICITNEEYPRIFKTRTINKKWGTYFGPYSHLPSMFAVLDLIKKLYQPRTCQIPLKGEEVKKGKYKVCLDYHIKKCGGPCIGKQSREDYVKNIAQAKEILKGNTRQVLRDMKDEMMVLAEELRFEEAEEIKQKEKAAEELTAEQAKNPTEEAGESTVAIEATAPSADEVYAMRADALAEMTDEEAARLKENIKVANLAMERAYLNDNLFNKLSDTENLYWNYIDQKGDIQIGWALTGDVEYDSSLGLTYEEFKEQYGEPVMVYNRFDADNFIILMQEMRDSLKSDLLKSDFDILIENMELAKETHDVEYVKQIYYILHDMDYYLLRYGPEDVAQYTRDDSTILKYYGVLEVYK